MRKPHKMIQIYKLEIPTQVRGAFEKKVYNSFIFSIESKEKRKRGRPIKEKYKNVPVGELNELKKKDNKAAALKYRQRVREERNEVKELKEENSKLTVSRIHIRGVISVLYIFRKLKGTMATVTFLAHFLNKKFELIFLEKIIFMIKNYKKNFKNK